MISLTGSGQTHGVSSQGLCNQYRYVSKYTYIHLWAWLCQVSFLDHFTMGIPCTPAVKHQTGDQGAQLIRWNSAQ